MITLIVIRRYRDAHHWSDDQWLLNVRVPGQMKVTGDHPLLFRDGKFEHFQDQRTILARAYARDWLNPDMPIEFQDLEQVKAKIMVARCTVGRFETNGLTIAHLMNRRDALAEEMAPLESRIREAIRELIEREKPHDPTNSET